MAIRPIVVWPETVLKEPCEDVTSFDGALRDLARDMVETMYDAPGVGLAANQIGVPLRFVVIDCRTGEEDQGKGLIQAANPEILEMEGEQAEDEGCLSFPGLTETIARPGRVRVRYQDLEGQWVESEGTGLLARAWCHEVDHISGRTILHRLSAIKRELMRRRIRKLVKTGEWKRST